MAAALASAVVVAAAVAVAVALASAVVVAAPVSLSVAGGAWPWRSVSEWMSVSMSLWARR